MLLRRDFWLLSNIYLCLGLDSPNVLAISADTAFVFPTSVREPFESVRKPESSLAGDDTPSRNFYRFAQMILTVLLYAMPAYLAMHAAVVGDPDVWWHLRTGQWIIEHHAVPRTDPYTTFGFGQPWAAYSWGFELLLFGLFRAFGLCGIVLYTTGMVLAITVMLHRLIRRFWGDTPRSVLLTFIVCFSMGHLYTPRPWLFTILFFSVEMQALVRFRATQNLRCLAILPMLFAFWANLHIQFIDGLLVLALACADEAYAGMRDKETSPKPARQLAFVAVLCGVATLANPYGFHIYQIARDLAAQPGVLNSLQELGAIRFRDAVDWSALALSTASIAVIARKRRPPLFDCLLLTLAVVLAFRSQRDVWVLAVVSGAILAIRLDSGSRGPTSDAVCRHSLLVAIASLLLVATGLWSDLRNQALQKRLSATMPVLASDYILRAGYAGPVFNDYNWGGYLIWSIHQKVCIDGRASFQGDARLARSVATWGGGTSWNRDPDLMSSHLIFGPRTAPLAQLLRQSPDYTLLYEDDLAVIFAHHPVSHIEP